jgi:O-antigen ligase
VFVFTIPWADEWAHIGGFVVSRWIGLAALTAGLLRVAVLPLRGTLSELHCWMFALAAWSGASIFWSLDPESTATRALTYSQLLVLACLTWMLATDRTRVARLLQAYVLGACVSALGTVANLIAGRTFSQFSDMDAPKADRYSIAGMNPNDLGLTLALAIPIILYLMIWSRRSWTAALMHWMQLGLCVIAILLTGSRGSLLAVAPALMILPLTVLRLPHWQRVLAFSVSTATLVSALAVIPRETWLRFFRLGLELTEGTMTLRTRIWAASAALFRDHPFLGVGAAAHATAAAKILGRPLVAHNTFLSALVELGVVGELLLLGLLAVAFHRASQMAGPERTLWILSLVVWLIGVCGITWESSKVTWLLLSLLSAHASAQREPSVAGRRRNPRPVI